MRVEMQKVKILDSQSDGDFLLVTGGGDPQVELFPIDPKRHPLPDCLKSLADLHTTVDYDAAGATMHGANGTTTLRTQFELLC